MTISRIAITMGDVAGVGPEIIAGAWSDASLHEHARPVVLGHPQILRRAAALRRAEIDVVEVDSIDEATPSSTVMPCLRVVGDDCLEVPPGQVDPRAGAAAFDALDAAIDLALGGHVDAITTAPLSKTALHAAGHRFPGHTEILAHRCGTPNYAMMLYLARDAELRRRIQSTHHDRFTPHPAQAISVVHVTLHVALRDVFAQITTESVLAKIRLAQDFHAALGNGPPRIGVAALNPHAGESGLFGTEEASIIQPAVDRARALGIDADGPHPADTLMVRAAAGEFDAVVAMVHDQGHIAVKLLGFERAVNITLGLPIIRTSVAHGTAFDLAWTGRAHFGSMIEATTVAARLANQKAAAESATPASRSAI